MHRRTLWTGRQPVKHHLDRIRRNLRRWRPRRSAPPVALCVDPVRRSTGGRTACRSREDAPSRARESSSAVGDGRAARRVAAGPRRNAPSRWRLRPAFRLTAAEATADRRAINLGRSVLGASRTLGGATGPVKESGSETCRNLRCFLFAQGRTAARQPHALVLERGRKKGRARRPGRKNSPSRERFRPPSRRTFRFRVVLLGGLRPTGAPCSAQAGNLRRRDLSDQGGPVEEFSRSLRPCRELAGQGVPALAGDGSTARPRSSIALARECTATSRVRVRLLACASGPGLW